MKVLLINPLMSEEARFFPLGLGYIAQVLLKSGHHVTVLDINAYKWNKDEVKARIASSDFDIAAITALITQYPYVKWLSKVIREVNPPARIIVGGGLASSIPQMLLERTDVDIAVIGEGEVTSRELIESIDANERLEGVRGICFKENNRIYQTAPREYIVNLDEIPFPARSLFPMEIYLQSSVFSLRTTFDSSARTTNLITSRGCPYGCVYCYHGIFGRKFRARTPDNITEEIKELQKEHKVNSLMFNDDTFVIDRERVLSLCDKLTGENSGISWTCNGRANLMDEELLGKMKKAGCKLISYGIESGNQKILDALNRKTTVEQIKRAIELTWKVGIIPHAYLMVGMFGETKDTIQDTVNLCKELKVGQGIGYVTLFPGTPLLTMAVEAGKVDDFEELIEGSNLNPSVLSVNLTDMTDKELIKLRNEAESSIVYNAIIARGWRLYKIAGLRVMMGNLLTLLRTSIPRKVLRKVTPPFIWNKFSRRKRRGSLKTSNAQRVE